MVKKMKRLVAVLLAGVMALTMLTACGGGSGSGGGNDFIDRSSSIEEALNAQMASRGTPFNNGDVNAIIEAISQKISEKPGEYYESALAYKDNESAPAATLFINLVDELGKNCETALNKSLEENLGVVLSFMDGSMTEEQIIGLINGENTTFGAPSSTSYYCVRVYHIANPADAEDNLWALFGVTYYELS